jgi:raffinose/stachyose/melibiose transport system permease protein
MTTLQNKSYTYYFLLPAGIIYFALFILPTIMSFFFSMTWWTLTDWKFIGLENFKTFLTEPSLNIGFKNTIIFAVVTCVLKVVLGLLLAVFLCTKLKTVDFIRSMVFFPTLISTIAVGIAFTIMMHPSQGLINTSLKIVGIAGPDWLGNTTIALLSVALVEGSRDCDSHFHRRHYVDSAGLL